MRVPRREQRSITRLVNQVATNALSLLNYWLPLCITHIACTWGCTCSMVPYDLSFHSFLRLHTVALFVLDLLSSPVLRASCTQLRCSLPIIRLGLNLPAEAPAMYSSGNLSTMCLSLTHYFHSLLVVLNWIESFRLASSVPLCCALSLDVASGTLVNRQCSAH